MSLFSKGRKEKELANLVDKRVTYDHSLHRKEWTELDTLKKILFEQRKTNELLKELLEKTGRLPGSAAGGPR